MKEGKLRLSSAHLASLAAALIAEADKVLRAALADMAPEGLAGLDSVWPLMAITDDESRLVFACRQLSQTGQEPIIITLPGVIAVLIPEARKTHV